MLLELLSAAVFDLLDKLETKGHLMLYARMVGLIGSVRLVGILGPLEILGLVGI